MLGSSRAVRENVISLRSKKTGRKSWRLDRSSPRARAVIFRTRFSKNSRAGHCRRKPATAKGSAKRPSSALGFRDREAPDLVAEKPGQERRVAIWCEAQGMVPQLRRVADPYGVPVVSGGA